MTHPTTRAVGDPDPPADHNALASDVNTLVGHPATTLAVHGIADTSKLALLGTDGKVLSSQLPAVLGTPPVFIWYGFASFPSSQPNRPATAAPVIWVCPNEPAGGGTTAGGTAQGVNGLDFWWDLP